MGAQKWPTLWVTELAYYKKPLFAHDFDKTRTVPNTISKSPVLASEMKVNFFLYPLFKYFLLLGPGTLA